MKADEKFDTRGVLLARGSEIDIYYYAMLEKNWT